MKRMLINATQQEELRVALVDGQKLYDLDIETLYSAQKKSNIYKGKITRIEPSLEAVFVDYGGQRHGFLPFKEISKEYLTGSTSADNQPSFKDMIKVGQEVLVQIDKEERGNKGAALTTFISLAGRFLVLMPNNPRAGGVSRRIQGEDRKELRDTLDELDAPNNVGVIVRTAGVGRAKEELQWDLDFLMQLWQAISEEYEKATPQRLIYQESNIIVRALRDYLRPDIGQIMIDDERVYQQAQDFMNLVMPNNTHKLKLYSDNIPLFTRYQIEGQIETAYQRNVQLPSGGELVIDYTEALVSVDINSSKATKGGDIEETAYNTNLEAADEIARQMRLRDLGGLVVIDFIDMSVSRHRKDIEQRLIEATKIDRARVQIGRISRFGLMELSRQRLRPSIDEASHRVCPRCKGQGSIRGIQSMALSLLRLIEEEAMKERTRRITGELPVNIATFLLNEKRAAIRQIELRNKVEVVLMANPNLHTPDYFIERLREDEIDENMAITPSYRLPVRRESVDENDTINKPLPEPEKAAVQGIVPVAPVPQQEKGLSSFISKVVSLFKDKEEPSKARPKRETQRSEGSRKKNGQSNGQSNGNGDTSQRKQQGRRPKNTNADNGGQNNANHKRNQRQRQHAQQDNAKDQNNHKEKGDKVTDDAKATKPARKERQTTRQPKDEVNPSVETLQNPPKEINGRQVRKGRPRDVHAVRGQGKAALNANTAEQDASTSSDKQPETVEKTAKDTSTTKRKQAAESKSAAPENSAAIAKDQTKDQTKDKTNDMANGQAKDQVKDHENDQVKDQAPGLVSFLAEAQPQSSEKPAQADADKTASHASKTTNSGNNDRASENASAQQAQPAQTQTAAKDQAPAQSQANPQADIQAVAASSTDKPASKAQTKSRTKSQPQATEAQTLTVDIETSPTQEGKVNPLTQLPALGQSIWFDNIHRTMLKDGELTQMIKEDDLRGVTSNPAIFQKAFAGDAYDADLQQWISQHDGTVREAFLALAIEDIQQACDQMMPVYEKTNGTDGMVSLEVSPDIANDSDKTIEEARELHKRVNRDNVMIKVPATKAGIDAIRTLTADGININVTLLFSVERYSQVLEAYIDGLKSRVASGHSIDMIRSVASFFVSRVDTKIDEALGDEHADLRGRAAIANAQMAYAYYLERISYDDWVELARKGAAVQRLLWASTGTKNPAYSDVRYVDQLIGVDTVNTVPPATYAAFKDHGQAASTLLRDIEKAPAVIQAVKDAGVDVDHIATQLEEEGVASFETAFDELLATLEKKIQAIKQAANGDEEGQNG